MQSRLAKGVTLLFSCALFVGFIRISSARCTGYSSPMTTAATSGTIQSPKYPRSYQDFENCQWSLRFPFDHRHYITYFEVEDVQMSHKLFGVTEKKCTGHLSFYGAETDCHAEKPFCNVYYVSNFCGQVVQEQYSHCNIFKRRTLIPTDVKFKSDSYYADRTPQRGFKLQFKFIDCNTATTTTTATSTTTTTTPVTTTSAITTTMTTTTPTTTTPPKPTTTTTSTLQPTTALSSANPPRTTSSAISATSRDFATRSSLSTRISSTRQLTSSISTSRREEKTSSQAQKGVETTVAKLNQEAEPKRNTLSLSEFLPNITNGGSTSPVRLISSTASLRSSTLLDTKGNKLTKANTMTVTASSKILQHGDNELSTTKDSPCEAGISDCVEKRSGVDSSIAWIAAPVAVGVLIILVLIAYILIARRKKKSKNIDYLVGIENLHYNELRKKDAQGVNY